MRRSSAIIALVSISLSACGVSTSKVQHHRLTDSQSLNQEIKKSGEIIGLGPIELPEHIDRPQVVRRKGESRLLIYNLELWEDPLEDSFKRALGAELAKVNTDYQIKYHPWYRNAGVERQLTLNIARFEANSDQVAMLEGVIKIISKDQKEPSHEEKFKLRERMQDSSVSAQVASMRILVSRLAEKISPLLK